MCVFVFNIPPTAKVIWRLGHGLVSSDRLVKPGIEPAIPGLQGKRFIHYTTAAPSCQLVRNVCIHLVMIKCKQKSGPRLLKDSCSSQLRKKFPLLIEGKNVGEKISLTLKLSDVVFNSSC